MKSIGNFALKACVSLDTGIDACLSKATRKMSEKTAKRVAAVGNMLTVGGALLLASDVALAASSASYGLGGWLHGVIQDTGQPLLEGFMWGGYGVGAVGVGSGINKFIQMTKPQTQATPKEAFAHVGGGGALMGLGYLCDRAVESMTKGGSTSFSVKTL